MKNSFSIIIITWNAIHHLKTFLPSVVKTEYPDFEIIIADNHSADGTTSWIKEHYPQCKIVTYDKNHGYARGNNLAVKYAKNDIVIFLNNDVKTDPDWLTELNNVFQNNTVGIAQPKILSYKNSGHFEYAGAAGGMIDRFGYPFCRGRIFSHIEEDYGQYDLPVPVFWASGAAMAIRKELFITAGGFDEEFEFHMEEIDLCWRCLKMGTEVYVQPSSVVYHLGGGSLPADSPKKIFYNYRNNLLMLLKNLDRYVIPKIFVRLILDGMSGVRECAMGKPRNTRAIIASHFSFYSKLRYCLRTRKQAKKKAVRLTPKHLIYQGSIVADFFVRRRKRYSELHGLK